MELPAHTNLYCTIFFLFLGHYEPQTFQQSIEGYDMPEKIRKFHQVNNVIQFMYDRPYHKGTKDRENEFKVRLR